MNLIIFVHTGYSTCLNASLLEARRSNPLARLVLIGDEKCHNKKLLDRARCEFFDISSFQEESRNFEEIYQHAGSNPYRYELFCLQRWFIINQFVHTINWDEPILYLDSDAFLFIDANRVFEELDSGIAVSQKISPAFTFIKNKKFLESFCGFIYESYVEPSKFRNLQNFVEDFSNDGMPHVSDMTLFGESARVNSPAKISDLREISKDMFFFCDNVSFPQGMEYKFFGKNIVRTNNQTFFIGLDRRKIISGGLHLQGVKKSTWIIYCHNSTRRFIFKVFYRKLPIEFRLFTKMLFYTLLERLKSQPWNIKNLK